ncbi:MAG: hypothetical protein ACI94Y_000863 [Maribacter sp.]|jgi:hypothetical protein
MKSPVLFLIILSFVVSCAGNSDADTVDVNNNVVTVKVAEVDSVEIKRLADAAADGGGTKMEKNSIEQTENELTEAKAKKAKDEKRRKELAAVEAAKPISELPVSQPVVKSAPRSASKKGPKMTFVEKSHNFGTIMEGDVVKYEFEYTNTGKSDLVIKDASASCGCTAPGFSFFPLEPGLSSVISVTFNSKNKLGAQRPQVTIKTNGYPSTHVLTLEGVVEK